jgi:4-hydroxy-tetrahydrodipicolinate reductase
MSKGARAVVFGLGAIGAGIARLAATRPSIELVGAIDSAADKAGRPLSEVLGDDAGAASGARVHAGASEALEQLNPDVVLHATGSHLPDVMDQLLACASAGASVVSTCEELSYPWHRHPALATRLDSAARSGNATLLGTGVNPGFVMDTLAVVLSSVCQQVEHVTLNRIVDVALRRPQLQKKVGMGLTLLEFEARVAAGNFGHIGLPESCRLLARGLGWALDSLDETIEPVPGEGGRAAGMRQTATATAGGRTVIEATVQMSAGAPRPRDEILIEATPPVRMTIEGGIHGDTATAALVVNVIPAVILHTPGLITPLDLPPAASRPT